MKFLSQIGWGVSPTPNRCPSVEGTTRTLCRRVIFTLLVSLARETEGETEVDGGTRARVPGICRGAEYGNSKYALAFCPLFRKARDAMA